MKKKTTHFLILFSVILGVNLQFAQAQTHFVNNGSIVTINENIHLNIDGHISMTNTGSIDNSGYVNLTGDWVNNSGTTGLINNSTGTVELNGADQEVSGTSSTVFHTIKLSNPGDKEFTFDDELIINGDLIISENLLNHNTRFIKSGNNAITKLRGGLESFGHEIIEGEFYFDGSNAQQVVGEAIFDQMVIENTSGVLFTAFGGLTAEIGIRESLILESGAQFASSSDGNVTLKSDVNGTAYLMDNSNLPQPVTGAIRVERFLPGSQAGYRFLSSPAFETDIEDDVFGFSTSGNHGVKYYIVDYDNEDPNVSFNGWTSLYANVFSYPENTFDNIGGETYRYYEGFVEGNMESATGYAFYTTGNKAITFRGTPNTGDIPINLTHTNIANDPNNNGWNLIGNPYPSPIDWDEIDNSGAIPTGMNNGFYVFNNADHSNPYRGTYGSYINEVATSLNDGALIAVGQSFWVKADVDDLDFTFSNAHRYGSTQPTFYKQAKPERSLIRMEVENTQSSIIDETVVYFEEGATTGYDHDKDAYKKMNTHKAPSIYSWDNENNYSIQGLPVLTTDMYIPLGLNIMEKGYHTIRLTELIDVPETSLVFFEDTETETILDLRKEDTYTLSLDKGLYEGRFYIRVSAPIEWMTEKADCNEVKGKFELNNESTIEWAYLIQDVDGNEVASESAFSNSVSNDLFPGEYTLTLTHDDYTVTQTFEVEAKQSVDAYFETPVNSYTVGEVVSTVNFTNGADFYSWNFNDGTIVSGEFEPSHIYHEPGVYEITLIAENAECSSTSSQQIEVSKKLASSVGEVEDNQIQVFGYANRVEIRFSDEEIANQQISIINIKGQEIVKIDNASTRSLHHSIEVPAGAGQVFFVVLENDKTQNTTKVFLMEN